MDIIQLLTYAAGLVFVVGFLSKIMKYMTMPMHVRWELYPVPHEGKAHGGSFFEEVDHWEKPRHKNHVAQLGFMFWEILFIRALKEDNPKLWIWSFPFHFGLYLAIAGLVLLAISAVLQLVGMAPTSGLVSLVVSVTRIVAIVGFVLGAIGSIGLFFKRALDPELSESSAPIDYMNLLWLFLIFVTGIVVWKTDPGYAVSTKFFISLITFTPRPELSVIQTVNLLLFAGFWAYFPFTHMTHMVSKYFMWDKVKFDDEPNEGAMDAKIGEYLAYPVTWASPDVGAEGGTKTWADLATTNPWAKEEK